MNVRRPTRRQHDAWGRGKKPEMKVVNYCRSLVDRDRVDQYLARTLRYFSSDCDVRKAVCMHIERIMQLHSANVYHERQQRWNVSE